MTNMTEFLSESRQLGVELTMADSSKAAPDLVLGKMMGEEVLGQPFKYELTLFTQDSGNPYLPTVIQREDMGGLLCGEASVRLSLSPQGLSGDRYFHGLITEINYQGHVPGVGISIYHAVVQPKLHLLEITQEYRIFSNVSMLEIIQMMLTNAGLKENTDFIFDLDKSDYGILHQVVQYEESDLNFVHRLMEESGVTYRFVHHKSSHMMVITNHHGNIPDIHDPESKSRTTPPDVYYLFMDQRSPGQMGILDYQFGYQTCTQTLEGSNVHYLNADKRHTISTSVFEDPFDYAKNTRQFRKRHHPFGDYVHYGTDGDGWYWAGDPSKSKVNLTTMMSADEHSQADHCTAVSNHRHIQCGYSFSFQNHPVQEQNQHKLITAASYEMYPESFPYTKLLADTEPPVFKSTVKIQSKDDPYVSHKSTPEPKIYGLHHGTVVAYPDTSGEESQSSTDGESSSAASSESTTSTSSSSSEETSPTLDYKGDKVRVDAGANMTVDVLPQWVDANSSIDGNNPDQILKDVRVAQFWAGKQRGAFFVPRVGDAVLLAYAHGDPRQPFIVGSVYHSVNTPFIDPSKHPLISGIRTRPTLESGDELLPEGYKNHLYSDLLFNDDAEDENKGFVLRVSRGTDEEEPYIVSEEENVNLAEGAGGFMVKCPETEKSNILLTMNSGNDVHTIYTGNCEKFIRNIKTKVGPLSRTEWNEFAVSTFAFCVGSKALYSVSSMTPGCSITCGLMSNAMSSFMGVNELASGFYSKAAGLEFGLSLVEWTALATASLTKGEDAEIAVGALDFVPRVASFFKTIASMNAFRENPDITLTPSFAELKTMPGIITQECVQRGGFTTESKMTFGGYELASSTETGSKSTFELNAHEIEQSVWAKTAFSFSSMHSSSVRINIGSATQLRLGDTQASLLQTSGASTASVLLSDGRIQQGVGVGSPPPMPEMEAAAEAVLAATVEESVADAAEREADGVAQGLRSTAAIGLSAAVETAEEAAGTAEDATEDADEASEEMSEEARETAIKAALTASTAALALPAVVCCSVSETNVTNKTPGAILNMGETFGNLSVGAGSIAVSDAKVELAAPDINIIGAANVATPEPPTVSPEADAAAAADEASTVATQEAASAKQGSAIVTHEVYDAELKIVNTKLKIISNLISAIVRSNP